LSADGHPKKKEHVVTRQPAFPNSPQQPSPSFKNLGLFFAPFFTGNLALVKSLQFKKKKKNNYLKKTKKKKKKVIFLEKKKKFFFILS